MSGFFRLQHTIAGASGLPEDVFVNSFYVNNVGTDDDYAVWASDITAFYNSVPTGQTVAVSNFMSGEAQDKVATIKVYRLGDAKPRPILYQTSYQVNSATNNDNGVPGEVALCLSYKTMTAPAGTPLARMRGRIYIGPLGSNALATTGRPNPSLITTLLEAGRTLSKAIELHGAEWALYSPSRSETVSGGPIQILSVDDAWDTQRRRGLPPTARTSVDLRIA